MQSTGTSFSKNREFHTQNSFLGSQDLLALHVWAPPLNTQENLGKQDIFPHSSARTWQKQTSVLTVQLRMLNIQQMVLH